MKRYGVRSDAGRTLIERDFAHQADAAEAPDLLVERFTEGSEFDVPVSRAGLIFSISAPSGTGKSTVAELVLGRVQNLVRSVSLNTRKKRSTEVDGVDYTFISREEFDRNVKEGNLIEFAEVYGSLRGTPKRPLQLNQSQGIDTICIIEWNGTRRLKSIFERTVVSIYLMPPSIDIVKQRIVARAQDSSEEIARRLANIEEEVKFASEYDYCVVNDDLAECVSNVVSIIKAERCRVRTQKMEIGFG
ncbi:MAG: guanylate kinase [Holosporales bacterium]|jgi:guanylate kinase|nr:guanylate kinase [Holosporales bacterium]